MKWIKCYYNVQDCFFFYLQARGSKDWKFFFRRDRSLCQAKCKKYLWKKRLKSNLRRKYLLHLLNEPQYLAKIRTPKLLKISNRRVTILCKRKLKKQLTKTPRKRNEKYAKNVLVSFPMSRLEFLEMIGNWIWLDKFTSYVIKALDCLHISTSGNV